MSLGMLTNERRNEDAFGTSMSLGMLTNLLINRDRALRQWGDLQVTTCFASLRY